MNYISRKRNNITEFPNMSLQGLCMFDISRNNPFASRFQPDIVFSWSICVSLSVSLREQFFIETPPQMCVCPGG